MISRKTIIRVIATCLASGILALLLTQALWGFIVWTATINVKIHQGLLNLSWLEVLWTDHFFDWLVLVDPYRAFILVWIGSGMFVFILLSFIGLFFDWFNLIEKW